MKKIITNIVSKISLPLGVLMFAGLTLVTEMQAQGVVNINVTGIPPIIQEPFTDQFEQNFRNGRYQVIFTYTNGSNTQPVNFRFRVSVSKDGRELLQVTSNPRSFRPGAYVFSALFSDLTFPQTFEEVLDQLDGNTKNQVVQEGTIPEGNYILNIEAIPVNNAGFITAPQSITPFVVRYPQPPILINPSDEANVILQTPVFNWTPVVVQNSIQYDFLLVEVLNQQAAIQAINSNRAHAQRSLIDQTTIAYTPDFLPLEEGQRYAWRVTASSPNQTLPIKNEGESPIRTFIYKEGAGSQIITDVRNLEEIILVPGFAKLIELDGVQVDETPVAYELNGNVTLQLDFNEADPQQVSVQLTNLRLQKGSLDAPVLMGGSLTGDGSDFSSILDVPNELVKLDEMSWRFGEGITATAEIGEVGGQQLNAEGVINLTAAGARGTIRASGSPLFSFGEEVASMEITQFSASFPEGTITGSGGVQLFDNDTACQVSNFAFVEGEFKSIFRCDRPFDIPLVQGSTGINMRVNRIDGDISANPVTDEFDYNLELNTGVGLQTENGQTCGSDALVELSSEGGIEITPGRQGCRAFNPKVDLGFIKLALTETNLQQLSYNPSNNEWDFEIDLAAKFEIPSFGGWESTELSDITVDEEGIYFSEIDFEDLPVQLPDFTVNDFGVELNILKMSEFLFPLFDWDKNGPGPWDLSFSGQVNVPRKGNLPKCLRGEKLVLEGGHVEQDRVFGEVSTSDLTECSLEFGAGYALNIDDLGGQFGTKFNDDGTIEPIGRLDFSGSLTVGQPFACEDEESVQLGDAELSFTTGLIGTVANVIPGCDITMGPFTARAISSSLNFAHDPSTGQEADMEASAELELSENKVINGSFDLNMMTGEFTDVEFVIDEPFNWGIPKDDPVLTFRINRSILNENGFAVDGRQQFLFDSGTEIGTTFDNLLIDLETGRIENGRIIFDDEFGLIAGIDPGDDSMNFRAVELGTELTEDPGLYMGLAGDIEIDANGIHADGQASASVNFNGETYSDLTAVDFSENFTLQLAPFKVGNGQADFLFDGTRFAWADPEGFHPDPAFFADLLLPEKLPLPTLDIAYLKLREDDELLVNASKNSDGNYVISTKPNQPLSLYAPFLDDSNGQSSNPPELSNVTLNNVVVSGDPTNPEVLNGTITVDVPGNNPAYQMRDDNVPLTLKRIRFGTRDVGGAQVTALHLLGDLHLFEEDIAAQQEVGFYIQSDGAIRASLDITGMNEQIPLLPNNQALLKFEGITGNFYLPSGGTSPNFNFTIDSGFEVDTQSGLSTGAEFDLYVTQNKVEVQNFSAQSFDPNTELDFGLFGLKLNAFQNIQDFGYTPGGGFNFAFALDVDLRIQPAGTEEIIFPIQGLEIRNTGIQLPPQNISDSSIPGLDLQTFSLAGFEFKPLTLSTDSPFTFSWTQGASFNPDVNMSFEVQLPEFEGTGLNPPDGLTFVDVGLENGFLTGSVNPFQPLGGAEISLVPGSPDSPTLMISEIFGSLSRGQGQNGDFQAVDIQLDGELGNLPTFTVDNPNACVNNPTFTLSLVQSKYFEGSVTGIEPCGYVQLGPAKLSLTQADLDFSVSNDVQQAELNGAATVSLPSVDGGDPIDVNGTLGVDLITGEISDGSISINQPFALKLPFDAQDPLLNFTVNQAVLDQNGLIIQGSGDLSADGTLANVQFNDLQMGFGPFEVTGGSASIASDVGLEIGIAPFSMNLTGAGAPAMSGDGIDMDLNGDLELNANGLTLTGTSTATIRFQGQEYASLQADLLNGFTLNLGSFAVNSGRADFFTLSNGVPSNDPLAILDESGFSLGAAVLSLLPARLSLPSEDIAYIDIKDANDNLLVDVTENQNGNGFTISTTGDPLQVVVPAVNTQSGDPLQADVEFSLTTDDAYNVTGGSLTLENDLSLEQSLNLPLSLTQLTIGNQGNGIELQAGMKVDLPGPLNEHEAIAEATINSNGFSSGSLQLGEHRTSYQPGITPLYTYDHSGTVSGSNEQDIFEVSLWGLEASFGSSNSIALSGTLSSSLIIDESEGDQPIFYTASWSNSGWSFDLDPGAIGELTMGNATLALNQQDGLAVEAENMNFYLVLNGTISMEDVLGEPLDVSIMDLEVGVDDFDTSPSIRFALGGSSGSLQDQSFSLFEGALSGTIESPTVTLSGRSIGISSAAGTITFLEKDIDYQNLTLDTDGGFNFGQIESGQIALIPDYVVLNSLTLTNDNGLQLDTELEITLPAPVNKSSTATISIYRDAQNQVQVDATAPAFDLSEEFALGSFGSFKLTEVAADIDPYSWEDSGIYANGELYKDGEQQPIITFGEAGNITDTPGIGITPNSNPAVQFNATGNIGFSYNFSVFEVTVNFDQISASEDGFEIELSGQAGLNLDGLKASTSMGYEGFIINQDGVKDTGNLDGTGDIEMEGIGSLTIGKFFYEKYENGKQITITDTSPKGPDELDGNRSGIPQRQENVTELLCFGPCPANVPGASQNTSPNALQLTINAGSESDSGGISGGVKSIYFMKTSGGRHELLVDSLNASLMDNVAITANFHYVKENSGFLLRASAAGEFSFGGQSVAAAIAGKFSNIGGETSYGLFVAAQTSVGIPIVPGIVDLTGAGGGFFWKPEQADLDLVTGAITTVGHELVSPDKISRADNLQFAAFLYASVGIAGGGGQYVVEGSTFMQITNQSFYIDARGSVLGLDGETSPANTLVEGTVSLYVQANPTFIYGSIGVDVEVPATITAKGKIEYFAKDDGSGLVWGIIGGLEEFDVYGGILSGDATFLASNDGFLLEASIGFSASLAVIKVETTITGSIWLLTDPDFQYPFGAYVTFEGKACLVVCLIAKAQAAFVTKRPSGFELYAAIQGCVGTPLGDKCISAWASITNNGFKGGFGKGDHNDLIAQAQAQKQQFEDKINSLLDDIQDMKDQMNSPPEFIERAYTGAQLAQAGANFYAMDIYGRQSAVNLIQDEVETNFVTGPSYTLPGSFQPLINNVMLAPRYYHLSALSSLLRRSTAKNELEDAIAQAEVISDQVDTKLEEGLQTSIEYSGAAETAFSDMLTSMSESPVSSVVKPTPSQNVTQSTSFDVDETMAEEQAQNSEALREEIDKLDQQFRESIDAVEANLNEMHGLLSAEFSLVQFNNNDGIDALNPNVVNSGGNSNSENESTYSPSVNALGYAYANVYSKMEKYFAVQANWHWMEWGWANGLRSDVQNMSGQIQGGIQSLNSGFNSALSGGNQNNAAFTNEAYRVAQRNQAVLRFSDDNFSNNIPDPTSSSSAPQSVKDIYSLLTNASNGTDFRDSAAAVNNDFWYEMHNSGLELYGEELKGVVLDEVVPEQNQMQSGMRNAHKNLTSLLDEFYTNKANLTSILYNMIDNYLSWRQSAGPENTPDSVDYQQLRQDLSDQLKPPQITDISASAERKSNQYFDTYFNITDISWNATHPVSIVESSIDIKEFDTNTNVSTGSNDYLSIGNTAAITVYPFKRAHPRGSNPSQNAIELYNTRDINAGVRVRGYAGNTAIRRATFKVDVGPGGQTISDGGGSVLEEDTTPPEYLVIDLDAYYESTTRTYYSLSGNPPTQQTSYWTNDGSAIKLHVLAHDPETGIGSYEYAVGTSQGGTDVIEWTELQGDREFLAWQPAYEITGQTRIINMQEDTPYYVSIRVTNGAGGQSLLEASSPVILDQEAPSKPEVAYQVFYGGFWISGFGVPVDPLLQTVPPPLDISQETVLEMADAETPEIKPEWTASSDNNGIQHYEYVITDSDEVPLEDFEKPRVKTTEDLSFTYSGGYSSSLLRDFETELYIYVRAKDYAGNYSDILTMGPRIAPDPTHPKVGKIQAKVNYSDVKLYLMELPYDPETQLQGIQYAVGATPGGTDLRDWPAGETVDFEWTGQDNADIVWSGLSSNDPPERYFSLPKSQLPQGARFYISYRSVNGKGMKSATRATGAISFDDSPPPAPSVDATYRASDGRLDINVSNIVDHESGIASVRYSVRYPNKYTIRHQWADMHNHSGIRNGTFSLSKILDLNEGNINNITDITVKISVTNGAGLTRTVNRQLSLSDNYNFKNYNAYGNPPFGF